jgi:hypothetical protein
MDPPPQTMNMSMTIEHQLPPHIDDAPHLAHTYDDLPRMNEFEHVHGFNSGLNFDQVGANSNQYLADGSLRQNDSPQNASGTGELNFDVNPEMYLIQPVNPGYMDEGNPIDTFGSSPPQVEIMDRAQPVNPGYMDEENPIDTFGSSPQEESMDRVQPSIRPILPRPPEATFVPAPIATDGRATHTSGPLTQPFDMPPKKKRGCQAIARNL